MADFSVRLLAAYVAGGAGAGAAAVFDNVVVVVNVCGSSIR